MAPVAVTTNPNIDPLTQKVRAVDYLRAVKDLPRSIRGFLNDDDEMGNRFPSALTNAAVQRPLRFRKGFTPADNMSFNSAKPVQNITSLLIYVTGNAPADACAEKCTNVFDGCVVPRPDLDYGKQLPHRNVSPSSGPGTGANSMLTSLPAKSCANHYYDGEGAACSFHREPSPEPTRTTAAVSKGRQTHAKRGKKSRTRTQEDSDDASQLLEEPHALADHHCDPSSDEGPSDPQMFEQA